MTREKQGSDLSQKGGVIGWMARNRITPNLIMMVCLVGGLIVAMQIKQGGNRRIGDQNYGTAGTAVSAVRTAEGFELLAMNRGTTVTAVTGDRVHRDPVDERRGHERVRLIRPRRAGR